MTIRRLFTALFFISLFATSLHDTLDPDMWWHLRTGEYILEEGIPHQDIYSFTVPDHEWVTHEWASEVVMWGVYQAGGWAGMVLFFALLITATFALVYTITPGRPFLAAFIGLLAAIASSWAWGARVQIFTLFFTAVFLVLVERVKDGKSGKRVFWALPLLTMLWVNFHSGYLLGIVVLGVYVVGESLQQWSGRDERVLSWPAIRLLGLMMVLSFLAAVLNPNGIKIWIYPLLTLGSSSMQAYILEWQSPDFHKTIFLPFILLAALGVLGLVFAQKRPSFTDLLLFGGTAAAGLLSARHIPLFAIISTPIVARYLLSSVEETAVYPILSGQAVQPSPPRLMQVLNWVVLITAVFAALFWTGTVIRDNEIAINEKYLASAVDYIEESGLAEQPGYNKYSWGGYLIWRGIPVFIDGRADVYGDDFFEYYQKTYNVTEEWRVPLDEYDIQYVFTMKNTPLAVLLEADTNWQQAYEDEVAQIFTRVNEPSQ